MKLVLALGALVAVPVLALAQVPGLPTPDDIGQFINVFLAATVNVKIALALVAAVWALRKYVVKEIKFFHTDEGGVILLTITSFLSMLAAAFAVQKDPVSAQWLGKVTFKAFSAAVIASGVWNILQAYVRVLAPRLIASTKLSKVPFAGVIIQKAAEYALKLVRSKLEKVAKAEVSVAVEPQHIETTDYRVDEQGNAIEGAKWDSNVEVK